jgi:hypothetical protein
MKTFDAFQLPGFNTATVEQWGYLEHGGARSRFPLLTKVQLTEICRTIREQRRQLVSTPVNKIVSAIDRAAARMQSDLAETTQLLNAVTGYSQPVVKETLQHMLADWRADSLQTMLAAELPDARILDQPIPDPDVPGKLIAAYGFPLTFHMFSGNVPGVAVTSIIRALLVKSAVLGKTAVGEPVLPVLFARALEQVAPELAACLAVTYWPGGTAELDDAALNAAEAVVLYGGEDAIDQVAARVPTRTRLIVHGPRISFGVVGPQRSEQLSHEIATAVAAYDQQGCVSPHMVFVLGENDEVKEFAAHIAKALDRIAATHPRGEITAEEAVSIRNVRAMAEFGAGEVFGAEQAGGVIFDVSPAFTVSCLNRVVFVKPVSSLDDVAQQLPAAHLLQSAAIAGFPPKQKAELIRRLGLAGVSRVTSFERLPWPPMHWHHDGSAPLRELTRWLDVEE